MSPLLFLAIAVVVPLLGMVVLGAIARVQNNRVTDDETEPFRRKLKAIAPRGPEDSSGSPDLRGLFRRAPKQSSRNPSMAEWPRSEIPAPRPRTAKSIRLIEREYSLPTLPPFSADVDDRVPRRARPRPPGHDRGNRSGS